MPNAATLLSQFAREMDEDYAKALEGQARARARGKTRDREIAQLDGRLDILARWAARLRIEASKASSP